MSLVTIVNLILIVLINCQFNGSMVSAQDGCPKHIIRYKVDTSLAYSQQLIEKTLQEFTDKTNLEFRLEDDDNSVRILFKRDDLECSGSRNSVLLTPFCECKGDIIHYVMVALEVDNVPEVTSDCENAELSPDDIYTINNKYYCCAHFENMPYKGRYSLHLFNGVNKKLYQDNNPWGAENIWSNSSIAYLIDESLVNSTSTIESAIDEFNLKTCLKFKPRENESDYIVFKKGDSCKSFIGKVNGEQPIELSFDCYECKSRIVHELIHTVGFSLAEHSIKWACEPGKLSPLNIRRVNSVYCQQPLSDWTR